MGTDKKYGLPIMRYLYYVQENHNMLHLQMVVPCQIHGIFIIYFSCLVL
jgi:hypothetical protein